MSLADQSRLPANTRYTASPLSAYGRVRRAVHPGSSHEIVTEHGVAVHSSYALAGVRGYSRSQGRHHSLPVLV